MQRATHMSLPWHQGAMPHAHTLGAITNNNNSPTAAECPATPAAQQRPAPWWRLATMPLGPLMVQGGTIEPLGSWGVGHCCYPSQDPGHILPNALGHGASHQCLPQALPQRQHTGHGCCWLPPSCTTHRRHKGVPLPGPCTQHTTLLWPKCTNVVVPPPQWHMPAPWQGCWHTHSAMQGCSPP